MLCIQVRGMMAVGWAAFLGSWVMNLLFYKVHPSSVEFSYREKLFIHIQGQKKFLWGYRDSTGEKKNNLNAFVFIFCLNERTQAEAVSDEKSCMEKLKDCICCCRGRGGKGKKKILF